MAIKLKNMTKRAKVSLILYLLLSVDITALSGLYVGVRWFWGPYQQWFDLIRFISIMFIVTALFLFFHYYPLKSWRSMKRWKIDTFSIEMVGVVLLFDLWLWCWGTFRMGTYGYMVYELWLTDVRLLMSSILLYFPVALVAVGCVILIIRRIFQGTCKETSVICTVIRRRRGALSFEKAVREKSRGALIIMTICLVVTVAAVWSTVWHSGEWIRMIIILIFLAAAYICYIKSFSSNRIYKDTAYLLQQIEEMADGQLNAPAIENEESLLYEGSQKLGTIGDNLKGIMEKQMKSERMKIDLITNVSHDLKTPLTSMIGYIDLLKKEDLSDEARDYVDVLSVKQEQLKAMIQDIFELSKSTSGEVKLELEELDMKKLLEQTLGDMEDAIVKSGMVIREKTGENSLNIIGDGKKLYRVLQNIIGNALKYSLKGTRIYIEAGKEESQVYVSVKNTAAYEMDFTAEEIMERFSRGDKSRNTEGHGLGLAIAESFTKNMGGSMNVEIDGDQFKVKVMFEGL